MLVIRLARFGRKNRPAYRMIVQEKRRAPKSKLLEIVGHYQPLHQPAVVVANAERIKHWMSKGAQLSDTVHNLLVEHKLLNTPKRVISRAKKSKAGAEEAPKT